MIRYMVKKKFIWMVILRDINIFWKVLYKRNRMRVNLKLFWVESNFKVFLVLKKI